jgi:tetratricopeptide (TPR) repeat protein
VPPLDVPDPTVPTDPETIGSVASVALFAERAAATQPGFSLTSENASDVASLCVRLDGLPLAIELAASRVAAFPLATTLARVDDRFRLLVGGSRTASDRQQTLKATIDWSYDLLTDAEATVLRSLCVFVGGIPLDAAEDVCASDVVPKEQVLSVIGELVDESLVVAGDGPEARFRSLETVREYGLERLEAAGERSGVERRHARWFLDLAERMRAALPGPDRDALLTRMELEHDNVRAAFDRSLGSEPAVAVRLAAAMWPFWLWRAYLAEGRRRIELSLARSHEDSEASAEATLGLASLTIRAGEVPNGIEIAERSASIAERLDDRTIVCRAIQVLGVAQWSQDDVADARSAFERGLEVATEAGFDAGRAASMHNLGILEHAGDAERGHRLMDEAISLFRAAEGSEQLSPPLLDVGEFVVPQLGSAGFRIVWEETFSPFQDLPCVIAYGSALANQAMLARIDGDLGRARALMEESLELFEDVGDQRAIGHALNRLGYLALADGDPVRARGLMEAAHTIRRRIGDWRAMMMTERALGNLAIAEGHFDEADARLREAAATFRRRGDRWGYAGAMPDLASLSIARGDPLEVILHRLDESIDAIVPSGRTRWLAWAHVQKAEVLADAGQHEAARAEVAEALTAFERLGDASGIARCRDLIGST